MPKLNQTPFQRHQRRWKSCRDCSLCEVRSNVVLARGRERGSIELPVDVLYVGEAPGISEDVLGAPFVGPAGQLLEQIIDYAEDGAGIQPTIAFTNVIACIPKVDGNKVSDPPKDAVKACNARFVEFVRMAKPQVIVLVGRVAARHVSGEAMSYGPNKTSLDWMGADDGFIKFVEIVHPAAILKNNDAAYRSLAVQRVAATLRDALETL